ncbi:Ankyrin Repeat And Lem Domain-Containing Protein 2 [Manis pentadactyla]|nr:Ankyrin Repeat And Lem Domain-Containing Protein 2 [Manis pentadactyla]
MTATLSTWTRFVLASPLAFPFRGYYGFSDGFTDLTVHCEKETSVGKDGLQRKEEVYGFFLVFTHSF